jgi:hypothetical protein
VIEWVVRGCCQEPAGTGDSEEAESLPGAGLIARRSNLNRTGDIPRREVLGGVLDGFYGTGRRKTSWPRVDQPGSGA